MPTVMVRGAGDVGSAIAWQLFKAGFGTILHDTPRPPHFRRRMAFTDALFDEPSELDGVLAKRAPNEAMPRMLRCARAIPISTEDFAASLVALEPAVIGMDVRAGEPAARIGSVAIHAPIEGMIRGLAHDGATVEAGTKILELDPRAELAFVRGRGKRPIAIAEGVLAVILDRSAHVLRDAKK